MCDGGTVARVDTTTNAVTSPLEVGIADASGRVATAVGSVWIASDATGVVSRVDPDTNDVVAEVYVAAAPASVPASTAPAAPAPTLAPRSAGSPRVSVVLPTA